MAGVGLVFDLSTLAKRSEQIKALGDFDTGALLDAIGQEVAEQTRDRLLNEKESPDGVPWVDWSENYAQTRHSGHSLLVGNGYLADSVQHVVNGKRVEVGSNLIYAAIHQFGGAEVGMAIPERPYLGVSAANADDLTALLNDFFSDHLMRVMQ